MNIAVKPVKAVQVRNLASQHSYLTPQDIASLTGIPLTEVKSALRRGTRDKRKSRQS